MSRIAKRGAVKTPPAIAPTSDETIDFSVSIPDHGRLVGWTVCRDPGFVAIPAYRQRLSSVTRDKSNTPGPFLGKRASELALFALVLPTSGVSIDFFTVHSCAHRHRGAWFLVANYETSFEARSLNTFITMPSPFCTLQQQQTVCDRAKGVYRKIAPRGREINSSEREPSSKKKTPTPAAIVETSSYQITDHDCE